MRQSLKHSLADSPAAPGQEFRYPRGSVVICNACAAPVAMLARGIEFGARAGRMASAFVPLRDVDLDVLGAREDIDAGVRAWVRSLTPHARRAYLDGLHSFRTGDPMMCPTCQHCFVQVISCEADAVLDKSYVIELVTIPPEGQKALAIRGLTIGHTADWLHPEAKGMH